MAAIGHKRKRGSSDVIFPTPQSKHPYLTGNFAPIDLTLPLTSCSHIGTIPEELADGQYVRNGSNPVSNEDLGRDAHWFDGDGMLAGVSFARDEKTGQIQPAFVNQYILTDVYLSALGSERLKRPILPSIATLVNPLASFVWVTIQIFRTVLLVILSHLPGSRQKIKKISAANTSIMYHDGRALALCESGPPLRIQLPELETVGWFDGSSAEGEPEKLRQEHKGKVFGEDGGLISFMREWTTAHPKVDPKSKEMLMFHSSFAPPYVQYSILPDTTQNAMATSTKLLNVSVPGIGGARMMHDFGVSSSHTIIMDLPLSLDPMEQIKGKPPVNFDGSKPSRFGVFPRHHPESVRWFETDACCIFHTANTWDSINSAGRVTAVNMLACRLTSATVIFAAGNIAPPAERKKITAEARKKRRMPFFAKYDDAIESTPWDSPEALDGLEEKDALLRIVRDDSNLPHLQDFDDEQCRLYYYRFDLKTGHILHQWALTAIPFEFPSVHPHFEMSAARYVYGCSTTDTTFGAALGKATKIDIVTKIDAQSLIERGRARPPATVTGVVDARNIHEVLASEDPHDPVRVFEMPDGWCAQEPRFVPASYATSEDDGYLLFYAFDESQLTANGEVPPDTSSNRARSELWILNAKDMSTIVGRVQLPQRVPYGLHGTWFPAEQIAKQRPIASVRTTAAVLGPKAEGTWMNIRDWIEKRLG